MSRTPFEDYVTIDTNVFEHLLNCEWNTESHINQLLDYLRKQKATLIVDDGGRISGEYNHRIGPMIRNVDDIRNEIYILRYWMRSANRRKILVSSNDSLMKAISKVIVERSEAVDRIFVYAAFQTGSLLISNDEMHIVYGPESRRPPRRNRLLRGTRRLRPGGAYILTSIEAHDKIQQCLNAP